MTNDGKEKRKDPILEIPTDMKYDIDRLKGLESFGAVLVEITKQLGEHLGTRMSASDIENIISGTVDCDEHKISVPSWMAGNSKPKHVETAIEVANALRVPSEYFTKEYESS